MTNKILIGAAVLAGVVAVTAALLIHAARGRAAPYELEYRRTDGPAYHATPVKRALTMMFGRDERTSAETLRAAIVPLRIAGLSAFFVFAVWSCGSYAGCAVFAIFLSLPPAFVYLARLDSWMDGVCWTWMALACMAAPESPRLRGNIVTAAAGFFAAWAVDAKLTAALVIFPAWILFHIRRDALRSTQSAGAGVLCFAVGIAAGFIAAIPPWLFDPMAAVGHVEFWRTANAANEPYSLFYPLTATAAETPWTVMILAASGTVSCRADRTARMSAILILAQIIFFTAYRSFDPDGIRHFYMILPFVSMIAGIEWIRLKTVWKAAAVTAIAVEWALR